LKNELLKWRMNVGRKFANNRSLYKTGADP
jgi:hypothetical protein